MSDSVYVILFVAIILAAAFGLTAAVNVAEAARNRGDWPVVAIAIAAFALLLLVTVRAEVALLVNATLS